MGHVEKLRNIAMTLRETNNFSFANQIDEATDYILQLERAAAQNGGPVLRPDHPHYGVPFVKDERIGFGTKFTLSDSYFAPRETPGWTAEPVIQPVGTRILREIEEDQALERRQTDISRNDS